MVGCWTRWAAVLIQRNIILLTYVKERIFLKQTVLIPSVPCTGSVVIPWIVLHTTSYGVFSLAFRNRRISVPVILVLEALWLGGAELFYWLLATRSFLPILKNFPVCWNSQRFSVPCHCCGHTCGWWWLCFVTSDTAYASPVPRVLDWASWLPCQVHSMPLTWHKEKKKFPVFSLPYSAISLLFLSGAAAAGRGRITSVNCGNL